MIFLLTGAVVSFVGLHVNKPAGGAVGAGGPVSLSVLARGRTDHGE